MSDTPTRTGAGHPDLLAVYVNDHLAAATGGIELVSRMIGRWRGTPYEAHLEKLLDELRTPAAAERFIVGTLASALWAAACAGLVVLLRG